MLTVLSASTMVDFDQVKDTIRGVQVALVCVMSLSNLALIYSRISQNGFRRAFFTARIAIQLSLALSGLLSALFYNVVSAIVMFDMEDHGLNCMTIYLANVYFFTVLPAIYCSGLILLATDLILRFKFEVYSTLGKSRVYSILCALLPWAVGVGLSCPLTFTDIQWHLKCANRQSDRHTQTSVICCVIVPACLVIVLALVMAVSVRPKRYYDFQRGFDSPMYSINMVTTSSSNTDNFNGSSRGGSTKSTTDESSSTKHLNGTTNTTNNNTTTTTTMNGNSSAMTSSTTSSHIQPISLSSSDDNAYPSFTHAQGELVSREKCKLLFSMVFVAVIVLPYGGAFMYITTEHQRMFTTLLFYMVEFGTFLSYNVCSNVLNAYPIIIPMLWMCTGY